MNNARPGIFTQPVRQDVGARQTRNWVVGMGTLTFASALLLCPHQVWGEEQYVSNEYGFSVTYPESSYEEQPIEPGAGVVFILRARSGGFPTFTVSTGEGGYQPFSDVDHANKVVNEYHRVGFRDAQVVKVSRYLQRGVPLQAPLVVVVFSGQGLACERRSGGGLEGWRGSPQLVPFEYSSVGRLSNQRSYQPVARTNEEDCSQFPSGSENVLRSKVLSVSTPSRHFTLTFMDYADSSDRGESRRLFDNFFIGSSKEVVTEAPNTGRYDDALPSWRVSSHDVLGFFTPILNGLMELTFGDLRPEEPSRLPVRPRHDPFEYEKGDVSARASRPLPADFLNSALPTSQGGRLFGLLALFLSGVMLKRLRRR